MDGYGNNSFHHANKNATNLKTSSILPNISANLSAVILSINEKGSLIVYFA